MASHLVFCGTYTHPRLCTVTEGPPGTVAPDIPERTGSDGIHVFRHDPATGSFEPLHVAAGIINPSFVVLDRDERFLFTVNELLEFAGEASGGVSSFAIDRATGELRFLSQVPSGGGNPCHLSLSGDGRSLLVANHEAASVAVFPIAADGTLAPYIDRHVDGAIDERAPHAHYITPDPAGRLVLATDTGTDRVMLYRQEPESGKLVPNDPPWGQTHRGGSPRHLSFHPSGRYLFANGEADLTLSVFRYDAVTGTLEQIQHLSTVPEGSDTGQQSTSQLLAHPNGRFVYVANRGSDTIAMFRFDAAAGRATFIGVESTRGLTPRHFQFDPQGRWLYVANQQSNTIAQFAIDPDDGHLAFVAQAASLPAPSCIHFTVT